MLLRSVFKFKFHDFQVRIQDLDPSEWGKSVLNPFKVTQIQNLFFMSLKYNPSSPPPKKKDYFFLNMIVRAWGNIYKKDIRERYLEYSDTKFHAGRIGRLYTWEARTVGWLELERLIPPGRRNSVAALCPLPRQAASTVIKPNI